VADLTLDYLRPLEQGRLETGLKFRRRTIPTTMQFFPGTNSPLDPEAGGKATYQETIPAVYGNYTYQTRKIEAEVGLRVEYVRLQYEVDPTHNTYSSDGYAYFQPFPTTRLTYQADERNKLSVFYNRRVQRPGEVDIRIFPKYDDAEIIKVGNPALRPQFSSAVELGYKYTGGKGYYYAAAYQRRATGTITRISAIVPGSRLIYTIFQNAGKSHNTGAELVISRALSDRLSLNANLNGYYNQINAFTVVNRYPEEQVFSAA
jgi:outer membrane receptor protein involved in Fe transport